MKKIILVVMTGLLGAVGLAGTICGMDLMIQIYAVISGTLLCMVSLGGIIESRGGQKMKELEELERENVKVKQEIERLHETINRLQNIRKRNERSGERISISNIS